MARDDRRQGAEDRAAASDLHRRPRPRVRADRPALVTSWTLTIRAGPRVERESFDALEPALDALATRVSRLAADAEAHPADTKLRRYAPGQQVLARLELSGPQRRLPRVHAGIDVHGDGSSTPYVGRVRRRPLTPEAGEDAAAAIRRALT